MRENWFRPFVLYHSQGTVIIYDRGGVVGISEVCVRNFRPSPYLKSSIKPPPGGGLI